MKIIIDNAIYIQKCDIINIDNEVPPTILSRIFEDNSDLNDLRLVGDHNKFDFIKFEDKTEVEYFKNAEWILDYNLVKNLDEQQLLQLYNTLNEEYKKFKTNNNKNSESTILLSKIVSLSHYICFIQGKYPNGEISYNLPQEVIEQNSKILKKVNNNYKKI